MCLVVKFLVGFGHVEEQLAGGEGRPVGLLKPPHVVHQLLGSHRVAVPATRYIGYGDFHNLTGFTSKKMPNSILKNVFFFNWLSHSLRMCNLQVPYSYMYSMTQFFYFCFVSSLCLFIFEKLCKCSFKK